MFHQILGFAAEVFLEPNIDTRYLKLAFLDGDAARVIDEFFGAALEGSVSVLSLVYAAGCKFGHPKLAQLTA